MVKRLGEIFLLTVFLLPGAAFAAAEDTVDHNAAGTALFQQGKIDAAIVEFQKAVSLNPKEFSARLNLGYAYERVGRIDDAMAAYRAIIDAQPDNFLAHNNLGVLYDKKGMYESAAAEFQSALQSKPGDSMLLKNLETAKKNKAAMQERDEQIARAEKDAQARPADPQMAYKLARLYAFYGKKDLAYEWLSKAIDLGYKDLPYIKSDAAFKEMREERNFQLLLR